MAYIELENIEGNSVSDWFREGEHTIDNALTCAVKEKASVRKQITLATERVVKGFHQDDFKCGQIER